MPPTLIAKVEAWAKANAATRSGAIRRLVELGLTLRGRQKQFGHARAERAKELTGNAIDKLTPEGAGPDERANRKRHLIKGPEEFREVRVDRAKAKGK
jgi:hypothetical protein